MQKSLLKFIAFDLMERLCRLGTLTREAAAHAEPASAPLLEGLARRVGDLSARTLAHRAFFLRLFDEAGLKDQGLLVNLPEKLNTCLYEPYTELCGLSRWLCRTYRHGLRPEVLLLLKEVMPDSVCAGIGRRAVAFRPECADLDSRFEEESLGWRTFDGVFVESLSILHRDNPLGWLGLVGAYARELTESQEGLTRLWQSAESQAAPDGAGARRRDSRIYHLIRHTVALRLGGPAYYFQSLSQALLQRDWFFLDALEPALFTGLNYLGFVDKHLVLLHEAAERARPLLDAQRDDMASSPQTADLDAFLPILDAVEKAFPRRQSFTDRQFQRALAMQPRLDEDLLISAHGLYSPHDLGERLAAAGSHGADATPVYDMLNLARENPNTPREIITAGWLSKLDQSAQWLYETLSAPREDGMAQLGQRLETRDHLLLKSIETSEIHRILLTVA